MIKVNPATLLKSLERCKHFAHVFRLSGFRPWDTTHLFIKNYSSWAIGTFPTKGRTVVDGKGERRGVDDVSILCKEGRMKEALDILYVMDQQGMQVNSNTYAILLEGCVHMKALAEGKWLHCHIIKNGFRVDIFLSNQLINMYAKCRSMEGARQVFDKMPERNVVSWSGLISGYAQHGFAEAALDVFCQMRRAGTKPNQFTFGSVLKACGNLGSIKQGEQVHSCIIKSGLELEVFVGSALVDMYVKCRSMENARQMFDKMSERNVVSWTTIISGYAQDENAQEALKLFGLMQQAGMRPNQFTLAVVTKACASLEALEQGRQVHAGIIKAGFESNVFAGNAIVDIYVKCGSIEEAHKMFSKMPEHNVVSWSGMISGYVVNGHVEAALTLFRQMKKERIEPNQFTFSGVLSACANSAILEQGKQVHVCIIKSRVESDVFVGSALVDMYAKCGTIVDARRVFDKLLGRNVVSWNAIIVGYAQHGCSEAALKLYQQMQLTGLKPDQVTFIGVLSACAYAGLVDEGHCYFDSMSRDFGILPRVDHYTCMVDLLGRAGHLHEAEDLINKMPFEPDSVVWRTLLAACTIHGNMELGKRVAELVLDLEPQDDASYVLLSNIYAAAGSWEDVAKARKMMKDRGVKKKAGRSWIEVRNRVHTFIVGDRSHPQTEEIYAKLDTLSGLMKESGYMPDTNFVLHGVEG